MAEMDDLIQIVQDILKRMAIDIDTIDKKTLRQLMQIQEAIDKHASIVAEAKKVVAHGLPIAQLATSSGVSRQTFYNKRFLMQYAERAIREARIEEEKSEIERLKKIAVEQKKMIANLLARDGELVEATIRLRDAEHEIAGLKTALSISEQRVKYLRQMLGQQFRTNRREMK